MIIHQLPAKALCIVNSVWLVGQDQGVGIVQLTVKYDVAAQSVTSSQCLPPARPTCMGLAVVKSHPVELGFYFVSFSHVVLNFLSITVHRIEVASRVMTRQSAVCVHIYTL